MDHDPGGADEDARLGADGVRLILPGPSPGLARGRDDEPPALAVVGAGEG